MPTYFLLYESRKRTWHNNIYNQSRQNSNGNCNQTNQSRRQNHFTIHPVYIRFYQLKKRVHSHNKCLNMRGVANAHKRTSTNGSMHVRTRTHARHHSHAHARTCTHAHARARTHATTHTDMHAHARTRTHARMHIRAHARVYTSLKTTIFADRDPQADSTERT